MVNLATNESERDMLALENIGEELKNFQDIAEEINWEFSQYKWSLQDFIKIKAAEHGEAYAEVTNIKKRNY